jgi:long-chain acyl-CoA synthetase
MVADAAGPLGRRFLRLARLDAGSPALLGGDGTVVASRGDLARAALALRDAAARFAAPAPVVLWLPNGAPFVAAFAGLVLAGRPVGLVDAAATREEVERCATAIGARALVTGAERVGDREIAWRGEGVALVLLDPGTSVALPERTAALKLTSGSSGKPRAIALSSRQLVADTVQIFRTMGVSGDDVTLAAIPLSHSYGVGSCLVPLLLAGTPLVFPASTLPAALAETLARARVAHFPAVPAMVRAIATLGDLPRLDALRVALSAGAPLAPADAAAFHAATGRKVHVFYGSSECGGITYDRGDAPVHEEGAVGTALEGVAVEVVDGDGRPLPPGAAGRVRVDSRATALAILPAPDDPHTLSPGRFLTGDLGRLDAAGRLTLTGRVAEELNVAGKKVHPEEVRRVLLELPGVRGAVVVGVPDPHRGELVAALIETAPGSGLDVRTVLQACRARLAPHKVPRRVVLVDRLPTSERGKLRRDEVLRLLRGA